MAQIPVPVPPRLPQAGPQYTQRTQEQFTDILRLYFNRLTSALQQLLLGFNNYATFYDTTTQTLGTALAEELVQFNTTGEGYGITASGSPPTRLTVSKGGVYNFQFSAQLDHSGGGAVTFWFWFKINGAVLPWTATKIVVDGPNAETAAAWNYLLTMQAGDYFELAWTANAAGAVILAEAATGAIPAIPSVIMTVTYVCPNDAG